MWLIVLEILYKSGNKFIYSGILQSIQYVWANNAYSRKVYMIKLILKKL